MALSFVFIFRPGSRILTEEEQKRRTEEVRDWAKQHLDSHKLDPRVLAEESYRLGDDPGGAATSGPVIALNFIEAKDFSEAVAIAESHPGLRYGVSIEVRAWRDPRARPAFP